MVTLYSKSKPPSKVDRNWIYWSRGDFEKVDHDSISALVVIGKKGLVNTIYKPTPVLNSVGKLEAIVGNIHDMKNTQSIFKIDGDEVGSCFAIEKHETIPENHRPEVPLGVDAVKSTCYEDAEDELALIALPNAAPLPYGFKLKSSQLDEDFVDEMEKISDDHGFWARQMYNAFDQYDKDHGTEQVVENLTNMIKNEPSTRKKKLSASDSATKNFSTVSRAAAGPIVDIVRVGEEHEAEQNVVKSYFMPNPTPQPHTLPDVAGMPHPVLEQMIETLKSIGSNLTSNQPTNIIVASQQVEEDKEMQESNNSSLQLFYAYGEVNWDEGRLTQVSKANFSVGFKNVLAKKSIKTKNNELTNLLTTIFSTTNSKTDNSYEDFELARMRSLEAFDPKFVTAHINANFSTTDLDAESTTKSTSINAFSYAPQNNKSKTLKKQADIQAHQNESLFNINEKDKKETSAYIEGIGQIESNEDVISACANICGITFAIVNTTGDKKPILHQAMMKIILFIRERSTSRWMRDNKKDCAHLPYVFMWEIQKLVQALARFSKNSVNIRKVQSNDSNLETSDITVAFKSFSTFMANMNEHVSNDTVPKTIPRYAKNFITLKDDESPPSPAPVLNVPNESNKRKPDTHLEQGKKKKKDDSEKSMKSGIFHASTSAPIGKILPPKDKLSQSFCLNFCAQNRMCDKPSATCKFGKHYSSYKFIPANDKQVILDHMEASKLLWFDETTMAKHGTADEIPPEFKHLLGDASGPKAKSM